MEALFMHICSHSFKEHNMHRPNVDLKEDVVWVNVVVFKVELVWFGYFPQCTDFS